MENPWEIYGKLMGDLREIPFDGLFGGQKAVELGESMEDLRGSNHLTKSDVLI